VGEGVAGSPLTSRLVRNRSAKFAELLRRSGKIGNPTAIAAESVRRTLLSALVAVPAALAGATFSLWFILAAAVPLGVVLVPQLRLGDCVAQRREGVERELPFFAERGSRSTLSSRTSPRATSSAGSGGRRSWSRGTWRYWG